LKQQHERKEERKRGRKEVRKEGKKEVKKVEFIGTIFYLSQ